MALGMENYEEAIPTLLQQLVPSHLTYLLHNSPYLSTESPKDQGHSSQRTIHLTESVKDRYLLDEN